MTGNFQYRTNSIARTGCAEADEGFLLLSILYFSICLVKVFFPYKSLIQDILIFLGKGTHFFYRTKIPKCHNSKGYYIFDCNVSVLKIF